MKYEIQCAGCKSCYQECRLQMDAISCAGGVTTIDLERCNRCGHCAAICPTGAMDHPLSPIQEETGTPFTPEDALRFLRIPRSVRRFQQKLVSKELMCTLLDAGRYSQTAKNTQGVRYHVVRGRKHVAQVHALYCNYVQNLPRDDPEYDLLIRPLDVQADKGFDALFYDCPQLIFTFYEDNSSYDPRSAQFALTFISLMAPSLHLGTCWNGHIQRLAGRNDFAEQLAACIGLEKHQHICGCMMAGYPVSEFRRFVARDPLCVSWWE